MQDRMDEEMIARDQDEMIRFKEALAQNVPVPDVPAPSEDNTREDSTREENTGDDNSRPASSKRDGLTLSLDDDQKVYMSKLQRFVHLDLKGAPPKPAYLLQILPVLKQLGATGLLVEYEDMFPFTGNLSGLAAGNAYSSSDIQRFRAAARENGLELVPLVQTFGHLEYVLKYERFEKLRESNFTPQVIAPSEEGSYLLLSEILEQVGMFVCCSLFSYHYYQYY